MLKCTLTSPLAKRSEEKITGIFLETVTGQRGILHDHMPIVAELKAGSVVRLKKEIGDIKFKIGHSSFFKFSHNEGLVLSQEFEELKEY